MTPRAIIDNLVAQGCAPRLTPDGCGIVVPKGAITEALKVAIRANKPAIIRLLAEAANDAHNRPELAPPTAPAAKSATPAPQGFAPGESALMLLAMRFADHIKASPQAREDWRRDVLETPPHLRQGLYNYLREQLRQPHLLWRTP